MSDKGEAEMSPPTLARPRYTTTGGTTSAEATGQIEQAVRAAVVRPPDYSAPPATQHGSSDTLGPGPARVLTDQIKVGVEAVWELVKQAYTQRAWSALGYASWDEYCTREFGTSRLRLPREGRPEVVASLRESGLSLRAIASATGLSRGTVQRELAPVSNGTPDAEPIDAVVVEEQVTSDHADIPDNVVGLDGKRYRRENPASSDKPRRPPITDRAMKLGLELSRIDKVFVKLLDDDRFDRNRDVIGSQLRHEVAECQKLMARMDAKINERPEQPEANLAPAPRAHKGRSNHKRQLRVLQNSGPLLAGIIAALECRFTGGFEKTCTPEIAAQYAKSLRVQGEQIIQISKLLQSHGETSTGAGQPA